MTKGADGSNFVQDLEREAAEREATLKILTALPDEDIAVGFGPYNEPFLYRRTDFLCGPDEREVILSDLQDVAVEQKTRRRPEPGDIDELGRRDPDYYSPFGCTRWTLKDDGVDALDVVRALRNRVTEDQLTDQLGKLRSELAINLNHVCTAGGIFKFGPASPPRRGTPAVAPTPFASGGPAAALVAVLDTGTVLDQPPGPVGANLHSHETGVDGNDHDPLLDRPQRPIAGHGIFVAGLLSTDPRIQIDPESTMSGNGITDEHEVLIDIRDIIDRAQGAGAHGPDVVCLALYGYPADGVDATFRTAFKQAMERSPKTAWVAAAGNDADTRETWPAAIEGVVGVASVDAAGNRSSFTNSGSWVRACAQGERIRSTYLKGRVNIDAGHVDFAGGAEWEGTSFAVPAVCLAIVRKMRTAGMSAADAVGEVLREGQDRTREGLGFLIG